VSDGREGKDEQVSVERPKQQRSLRRARFSSTNCTVRGGTRRRMATRRGWRSIGPAQTLWRRHRTGRSSAVRLSHLRT